MRLRHSVLLCCTMPIMTAADLAERPLYLAAEFLPSKFEFTIESVNGTFHGSESAPNLGVAVGLRWSLAPAGWAHGLVVGAEVASETATFTTGKHVATELRALTGWAVALDRDWTLMTGLRVGYGRSHLNLAVANGSDLSLDGRGWSMEPNVELLWSMNDRFRLSLGAGWRSATYSYQADDLDISLLNRGPTIRFGFEWQLSVAPRLLR